MSNIHTQWLSACHTYSVAKKLTQVTFPFHGSYCVFPSAQLKSFPWWIAVIGQSPFKNFGMSHPVIGWPCPCSQEATVQLGSHINTGKMEKDKRCHQAIMSHCPIRALDQEFEFCGAWAFCGWMARGKEQVWVQPWRENILLTQTILPVSWFCGVIAEQSHIHTHTREGGPNLYTAGP